MPSPRVFLSSTCYDMGYARERLRIFIESLGFTPVLSDHSDILFDPAEHTHTSCINEVINTDIVILLIGARFGGHAVPEALQKINFEKIKLESSGWVPGANAVSVTQAEVLKAIESNIPVFTFVESKVLHEHHVYEKNKLNAKVIYPSLEKQETAPYIFEFINYIRKRETNNYVESFVGIGEIETKLRKQWSSLFQALLHNRRVARVEERRYVDISEKLEDLKTAVLTTIQDSTNREIARGVVKYRRMIEFIDAISERPVVAIVEQDMDYDQLLETLGVEKIEPIANGNRSRRGHTAIIMKDDTFYEVSYSLDNIMSRISAEWAGFQELQAGSRKLIAEALTEQDRQRFVPWVRKHVQPYAEYVQMLSNNKTEMNSEKGSGLVWNDVVSETEIEDGAGN